MRARFLAVTLAFAFAACVPPEEKPRTPKPAPCPPPPEPERQSVVVGTIGKLHMVENRYGLSRLGDVVAAFKPDLVLLAVRREPYHEGRLEDASFEMTYVHHLAKTRGIPVEPIDWYREQELGAPPAALEPFDVTEIAKRERAILEEPRLYTFEQANAEDLMQKVLLATNSEARYRGGNALASRRTAWMQHFAADAVARFNRPKRVLAFVDLFDRPAIDLALRAVGYTPKSPVDVVAKAKEVMMTDIPSDVLREYELQKGRARERAAKASGVEKTFWTEKARVLDVVVERKASCCVTQAALNATTP
jgi:hypothetical protein